MICSKLTQMRKLYLNHNSFEAEALSNLHMMTELKLLDIRNNKLGDSCAKHISRAQTLTEISLS